MTTRIGTDVVEIRRIQDILRKYGDHFTERFFGQHEREFARQQPNKNSWYARFWAGREAVFKVFGTGNYWQDTRFEPEESGRLKVVFKGSSFHQNSPVPRDANWDLTTTLNGERVVAVAVCEWSA